MNTLQIIQFTDSGHGWYKIARNLLVEVGAQALVSKYSYQHENFIYLEGDYDAPKIFKMLQTAGYYLQFTAQHADNSPIRGYARYESSQII